MIKHFSFPQIFYSKILRAVVEFNLINDNDKILIGLSGGKDSLFLTYALACLKHRVKKIFSLSAVTIDSKFSENFTQKLSVIKNFCDELNIQHKVIDLDVPQLIHKYKGKSHCFTCAYFRRAVINRHALKIGANKIAYAHHLDDAVETFLMNLLSSGQLSTFQPRTFLSRTELEVIRPLVYLRENEIRKFISDRKIETLKSFCPFDGSSNRQRVKKLIPKLEKEFPNLFFHLSAAMRKNSVKELWDASKSRKEMRETYFTFK